MKDQFISSLKAIASGSPLSNQELEACFELILTGAVPSEHVAAFLMGLAVRGETEDELLAGAKVMRKHARSIQLDGDLLDTCGTGGLNWTSLNTSTASAIVLASCGVTVAKHGNRSVPPKTGSADVLEALGVGLDLTEDQFRHSVDTAGIGFMFARSHHSAMKHVAPVRASLGIRTIFNLLGPLSNPANATHQVLGVYHPDWLMPMAKTLQALGVKRAMVVHGEAVDGRAIDELSIAGKSKIVDVSAGSLREYEIFPADVSLETYPMMALEGGSPESNANAIRDILSGAQGAFRDAVLFNAAAGLLITEKVDSLKDGVARAAERIDDGSALKTLAALQKATTGEPK